MAYEYSREAASCAEYGGHPELVIQPPHIDKFEHKGSPFKGQYFKGRQWRLGAAYLLKSKQHLFSMIQLRLLLFLFYLQLVVMHLVLMVSRINLLEILIN